MRRDQIRGTPRASQGERPAGVAAPAVAVSIVIPLFNEEASIAELLRRLTATMQAAGQSYEVICVDDGSTDATPRTLRALREADARIKIIRLRANFGQTAALAAGFAAARGDAVVAMDGDLQHSPEEIPRFLDKLAEGYDIVSGWRTQRVDSALCRRLPSRVANWMMAKLSGIPIHDFGTTFKAYRRHVIRGVRLYGDFHRFIPALTKDMKLRVTEIPVANCLRPGGSSNYGLGRTLTVFFDLMRIKILTQYMSRPLHLFGSIGLLMGAFSACTLLYLVYVKFTRHVHIMEERGPLFLLMILTMIVGIQLVCVGILGEMIFKMYADTSDRPIYSIEETVGFEDEEADR
ncbi:MAG: glycosyltransferase family 2 protein [Candidatus Eisenbacteria sp.]|nr:glycosyltransferase family 2 protein [Candidatus Eisenbacteria bacterium]